MILASYESTCGYEIELHYENGKFSVHHARTDRDLVVTFIVPDMARVHYDYARDHGGKLFAHWPGEKAEQ